MTGQRTSSRPVTTVLGGYLPMLGATAVIVLPLAWMLLATFKNSGEIVSLPIQWLPTSLSPDNYVTASEKAPFGRFFVNSVVVTAVGASIKLVLAVLTAYALVFVRFPAKKAIFALVLVALMVPPHMSLVPNYTLVAGMGGRNTLWGIVLPGLGTAFGTFLLRQQFLTLPASIVEAAEIDGASHWRRLVSVVAPVSAPTIATVALISIVNEWNEYLWPLIITDDPRLMTLPVGLTLLQNIEPGATSWGVLMAGAAFVILPVLVVFAALQRYIVAGLTQGAVTG
ncbi:carbohydrate ABC transporter permease [Sanguibacter suaedae]|uniref:Carbohydrate ABC transporter permease n=1 Tax=Sanguibacter suaedae TaxID=2795737 RepID=A0A934I5E2_9MICO|nr:carbohydrate ABC transporter permease [Sanguibacter suaedae]MBI9115518.1 carbohydrate ABC transporter permease [Sanguibacter suaedae]